MVSIKEGNKKKIHNSDVIQEIQKEMEGLRNSKL